MAKILIIDDDQDMSFTLCRMVESMGHKPTDAFTLKQGLEKGNKELFDVIFLDVRLPDGSGLSIIPKLQQAVIPPEIIIVTAYGDPGGAEIALKNGVWDYLTKPLELSEMRLSLSRAIKYRSEKQKVSSYTTVNRCGIVGSSPLIQKCIEGMAQAATTDASVLLTGETGTGKELMARAIHNNSHRSDNRLIIVDCTALPEKLVESILFGHVKGAFTGADTAQEGLIKEADGGTLFLDEVGELPLHLQKIFLRVLQEHRFRPLGRKQEVTSDFRLIAATNRNLEQMVEKGLFRQDLLFRLKTLKINLPPLRQRDEDIKELVLYHLSILCDKYNVALKRFSSESLKILDNYEWPGNVRELVNSIESAITAALNEPIIYAKHLPTEIRVQTASMALSKKAAAFSQRAILKNGHGPQGLPTFHEIVDNTKKKYLKDLMRLTNGNIGQAIEISGLPKSTLYDQLKKMDITLSDM